MKKPKPSQWEAPGAHPKIQGYWRAAESYPDQPVRPTNRRGQDDPEWIRLWEAGADEFKKSRAGKLQ